MRERSNPYASPYETSQQVEVDTLRANFPPPGLQFVLLWVAASVVSAIVRWTVQSVYLGLLGSDTPQGIVVAALVIDPIIGLLSGVMHWMILNRWVPRVGWWPVATTISPLA